MVLQRAKMLSILLLLSTTSCSTASYNTSLQVDDRDTENLKDLLFTSLQSVVSLNDLVTTLTVRVADLTLSLAQTKADVQRRETEVDELVAQTRASLEAELAAVKSASREVMIVSGEETVSEPSCARVCAGTTGRGTTTWNDVTSNGVKLSVDISQCGFEKVPTVTTSVEGKNAQWRATGLAAVYSTTTSSFDMWVEGLQHSPTGGNAEGWGWNVEWVAVGFVC